MLGKAVLGYSIRMMRTVFFLVVEFYHLDNQLQTFAAVPNAVDLFRTLLLEVCSMPTGTGLNPEFTPSPGSFLVSDSVQYGPLLPYQFPGASISFAGLISRIWRVQYPAFNRELHEILINSADRFRLPDDFHKIASQSMMFRVPSACTLRLSVPEGTLLTFATTGISCPLRVNRCDNLNVRVTEPTLQFAIIPVPAFLTDHVARSKIGPLHLMLTILSLALSAGDDSAVSDVVQKLVDAVRLEPSSVAALVSDAIMDNLTLPNSVFSPQVLQDLRGLAFTRGADQRLLAGFPDYIGRNIILVAFIDWLQFHHRVVAVDAAEQLYDSFPSPANSPIATLVRNMTLCLGLRKEVPLHVFAEIWLV